MHAGPRQRSNSPPATTLETLAQIYTSIEAWGLHRYGWLFIAAVLVIPAVVAGNMVQFYLTALVRRKAPAASLIKPLVGNFLVLMICSTVIAVAFYLYL